MKLAERSEARRLRSEGRSLKSIAAEVGVAVSSVSRWVADIELSEDQHAALRDANPRYNRQVRGHRVWQEINRARRLEAQASGRQEADEARPLHLAGCMLYWAEGARSQNAVVFTNSDADMVEFFVRFLRECYGVSPEQVALTVNCFTNNGLSLGQIESWWLERLSLPRASLRKAAVNRPSSASKRRRRTLLYGTARISIHSTAVAQSIYGAIQAYTSIERPAWLDMSNREPSPKDAPRGADLRCAPWRLERRTSDQKVRHSAS